MHIEVELKEGTPVRSEITDWEDPEYVWMRVLDQEVQDAEQHVDLEEGEESADRTVTRLTDGRLLRIVPDFALHKCPNQNSVGYFS